MQVFMTRWHEIALWFFSVFYVSFSCHRFTFSFYHVTFSLYRVSFSILAVRFFGFSFRVLRWFRFLGLPTVKLHQCNVITMKERFLRPKTQKKNEKVHLVARSDCNDSTMWPICRSRSIHHALSSLSIHHHRTDQARYVRYIILYYI